LSIAHKAGPKQPCLIKAGGGSDFSMVTTATLTKPSDLMTILQDYHM
jgi:hypothetical protein